MTEKSGDADHPRQQLSRACTARRSTAGNVCRACTAEAGSHRAQCPGAPCRKDRAPRRRTRKSSASQGLWRWSPGKTRKSPLRMNRVDEAFAQLRGAQVLWLPTIQAGVGYINHDGPLQNSDGSITVGQPFGVGGRLGMYAVGGGARRFPAYRPSSPLRTPFSSLALRTRRRRPGNTRSRPRQTTCFFSRRWRISISCGRSSSRRLHKRRSTTRNSLPN